MQITVRRTTGDRHRKARLLAGVAAFVLSAATQAHTPKSAPVRQPGSDVAGRLEKAFAAIDQAVASATVSVPGIVVGITDRSELRRVIVHGFADLKTRAALRPDSPFALGSISKSFTAVALLQLAEEGRFDPHAPVSRYMPWFKVKSDFASITGHHLMSHTSGLPNYLGDLSSSRYAAYAVREFEPTYAPGAHFWYSNTGFQILGYVLEDIEKQPFRQIVQRRVLEKLGMTASSAVIDDAQRTKLPVSYARWPYDGKYAEAPWFEYAAADGSIVSTAADMCAYARFLLNRGQGPHGTVLSPKAFALLTTPVLDDYAYGLEVHQIDGDTVISHSGSIAGFENLLEVHMNDGFGVVLLTNGGMDGALQEWIVKTIRAAYRGELNIQPPQPKVRQRDAQEYAGVYRDAAGGSIEFKADHGSLLLKQGAAAVHLLNMGADNFRTAGGANNIAFFFGRESEKTGRSRAGGSVTDVSTGSQWYANDRYGGPRNNSTPPDYLAYVGHYENHSPEGLSVRLFIRNGRLTVGPGETLVGVGPGQFRPEQPDYAPERFRFDTVIDGHALRLSESGVPLYRMDTP